jgi:hypothetical protein
MRLSPIINKENPIPRECMPVDIRIYLVTSKTNPFHCGTHICACYRDADSNSAESTFINYPQEDDGTAVNMYTMNASEGMRTQIVTLRAPNKSFKEFHAFCEDLRKNRGNYNCLCHNCVDNLNLVLDELFGKGAGESNWYKLAQCMTSICCLCGLGCSCCPGPCGVSVPYDGFKRALRLSNTYGILESAPKKGLVVETLSDLSSRKDVERKTASVEEKKSAHPHGIKVAPLPAVKTQSGSDLTLFAERYKPSTPADQSMDDKESKLPRPIAQSFVKTGKS